MAEHKRTRGLKKWLKENHYTEEQMQAYWNELIGLNSVVTALSRSGINWDQTNLSIIASLPTAKEKTLKTLEEKRMKEEAEQKAKEEAEKAKKYYEENFESIMVNKIDKGENLTEKELKRLAYEYEIEKIVYDKNRWTMPISSVCKLLDRYFMVEWQEGLTEYQEDEFLDQPYEVELQQYQKVTNVRRWVKKGSPKPKVNNLAVCDTDIEKIIDKVTEFMYCNFKDCHMEEITLDELEKVRKYIKENGLNMIKS